MSALRAYSANEQILLDHENSEKQVKGQRQFEGSPRSRLSRDSRLGVPVEERPEALHSQNFAGAEFVLVNPDIPIKRFASANLRTPLHAHEKLFCPLNFYH